MTKSKATAAKKTASQKIATPKIYSLIGSPVRSLVKSQLKFKWSYLLLSSLLTSMVACSPKSSQSNSNDQSTLQTDENNAGIVNGVVVKNADPIAKSTVGLKLRIQGGVATCTGTLISPKVILTAAHCIVDARAGNAVFNAAIKNAPKTRIRPVVQVLVHPNYNPDADKNSNDLALVKIGGQVPVGAAPIDYLKDKAQLKDGMLATLAGFGATNMVWGQSVGSDFLRQATVVLSDSKFSDDEVLFQQYKGSGACHGDSGGPAYTKDLSGHLVVFGITSRSATLEGGSTCLEGSVYTNTAAYNDFIAKGVASLEASAL